MSWNIIVVEWTILVLKGNEMVEHFLLLLCKFLPGYAYTDSRENTKYIFATPTLQCHNFLTISVFDHDNMALNSTLLPN